MKYDRFKDIPEFTSWGSYHCNVGWGFIEQQLESMASPDGIDLDPDFQRGHVWNEEQQIRYVEFILRGGKSSRDILFNAPGWACNPPENPSPVVLVDGKQRIEAVRRFMRNEIPAFGNLLRDYKDKIRIIGPDFVFHVNNLTSRAEVLQWYLDLNAGGVVHTAEEIEKVRGMLKEAGV